jgi:hypothetical protein
MKFLIDAQLPRRLAHQLRAAGFETIHTLDLPQGNRTSDQALINLLQLSVSADNSIQSWFRSSAASRHSGELAPHIFVPTSCGTVLLWVLALEL